LEVQVDPSQMQDPPQKLVATALTTEVKYVDGSRQAAVRELVEDHSVAVSALKGGRCIHGRHGVT
jgi:hypothetical protein